MELADVLDSKSCGSETVPVRPRPSAPNKIHRKNDFICEFFLLSGIEYTNVFTRCLKVKEKQFTTIREYLYWCYSNMAMAHVALKNEHIKYEKIDYMIRAKLYKGLCCGTMEIASLYDDERYKLNNNCCNYCGNYENLSLDHLIPRFSGGNDTGNNLVYACKKCNCSKGKKDFIVWCLDKNEFPSILVLRRYLKLAFIHFEMNEVLDLPICELINHVDLFRIDMLPYKFPLPNELKL